MQTLELLLRYYPKLYQLALTQRQNIIHQYRQAAFAGGRCQGQHSDPTAAKVIRLSEIDILIKILGIVRQWLDEQLPDRDRRLLLDIWRYTAWRKVNQKHGQAVIRWRQMIDNLTAYVGHVLEPAGNAYAVGRLLSLLEL